MKIDLHCHTKKVKTGELETRNVSADIFATKIQNADVKIVAITNHNTFDISQYNEFLSLVHTFCQIWPGVEIDIEGKYNKWHLIIVANPQNIDAFNAAIEQIFDGKDIETCVLSLPVVVKAFSKCDIIYIPHFHKKPAISDEDLKTLLELVDVKQLIFNETSDFRTLGVFANHQYSVIIGSDINDWKNYEGSTFAELRLPVSSFEQFCLLAKRDKVVVETLLQTKKSYTVKVLPHPSVCFDLKIFEEINIIFGQKGTGKSQMLNSIYHALTTNGLKCEKYCGAEKDENFKALTQTNDMVRDIKKLSADACLAEYDLLFNWSDKNPTLLSNYLNWYTTKDNYVNKSRMKITNAVNDKDSNAISLSNAKDEFKEIKKIENLFKQIRLDLYLSLEEKSGLDTIITKLSAAIRKQLIIEYIRKKSVELANFSLGKIKSIADKNSNTVSKPSSTGFFEFSMNRLELRSTILKITGAISNKEYTEKNEIGELEDKGKIYIKSIYRMLNSHSKTSEFKHGIRNLREIKEILVFISVNFSQSNILNNIKDLVEKCFEESVTSAEDFLGTSKMIVNEDDIEYSPSNGERAILLLQHILKKNSDVYILDEPELGMGNSYIDKNIRPQLNSLAKLHKTVVVATHNANIAVRTLPYMSIFRTHSDGVYHTYVGNPFRNELVNIDNPNDIKIWADESMHTLEGGPEAFYERKNIYESGSH